MLIRNSSLYITPLFLMLISLLNYINFPLVNIFVISVILYHLYLEIKLHPCSSLLVLFILYAGYFFIRITLLELEVFQFFNHMRIDSDLLRDPKWILVLITFTYSFMIGYKSNLDYKNIKLIYSGNYVYNYNSKVPISISFILFIFSFIFFLGYVNALGGFGVLARNYSTENFMYVVENNTLSNYKNFTVWFLFSD